GGFGGAGDAEAISAVPGCSACGRLAATQGSGGRIRATDGRHAAAASGGDGGGADRQARTAGGLWDDRAGDRAAAGTVWSRYGSGGAAYAVGAGGASREHAG